jgi:hypothetical protein
MVHRPARECRIVIAGIAKFYDVPLALLADSLRTFIQIPRVAIASLWEAMCRSIGR